MSAVASCAEDVMFRSFVTVQIGGWVACISLCGEFGVVVFLSVLVFSLGLVSPLAMFISSGCVTLSVKSPSLSSPEDIIFCDLLAVWGFSALIGDWVLDLVCLADSGSMFF